MAENIVTVDFNMSQLSPVPADQNSWSKKWN